MVQSPTVELARDKSSDGILFSTVSLGSSSPGAGDRPLYSAPSRHGVALGDHLSGASRRARVPLHGSRPGPRAAPAVLRRTRPPQPNQAPRGRGPGKPLSRELRGTGGL